MAADSSLHTVIPESIPVSVSPTRLRTVADLLHHVCVPPERIRMTPPPGTATEDDRVALSEREGRSFELIDGVLVEKSMGAYESALAIWLGHYFGNYLVSIPHAAMSETFSNRWKLSVMSVANWLA